MSSPGSLLRGQSVRVRGDRWRVVHVTPYDGCSVVELAGAEASNAGSTARFIAPFESIDRLPLSLDCPRVVRRSAWRSLAGEVLAAATPAWWSLRTAARAAIALLPYQLEPALAMTRGLACRFLLADEVGLGKTIQAGLLAAELLARERDARILIVTPAGLREQWRDELHDRFAIDAEVIDAAALVRAAADLPPGVNPWAIPGVAITSIDFLKRADVVRSIEPLVWDLVAFDEAHLLCGRSDRSIAAGLIATRARRVVLITATPHSGDEDAFARLRGLGQLGADDHLLMFRRSRLDAGIARQRTSRRLLVSLAVDEARLHRALDAYADRVSRDAPADHAAAAKLAMIVLARRAASSAASLARSVERRIALLRSPDGIAWHQLTLPLDEAHVPDDDEPLADLAAPGLRDADAEERLLQDILVVARRVSNESKIAALRRLLRRSSQPALVFTEYRDTLRHVAAALDVDAAFLHGGLTARERAAEARRFTHGGARVLLATDAASEGLNLHRRCRLVISLDVPWTPLRLEQRIGRVDRLGQTRRVHAITFVARGTSDMQVVSALESRAVRAEQGAPFGQSENDRDLKAHARAEVDRLAMVRRMRRSTRPVRTGPDRPALTLFRCAPRSRLQRSGEPRGQGLILALRIAFVDSTGAVVWDTLKGLALAGIERIDERTCPTIAAWFAQTIGERAAHLCSQAAWAHDADVATVAGDINAAVAPLLARERALLERVAGGRARLAAPLLQPGLFDRRAIREAEAQRRVADEAAGRSRQRIELLGRRCDVRSGDRHLVFAIAWWR